MQLMTSERRRSLDCEKRIRPGAPRSSSGTLRKLIAISTGRRAARSPGCLIVTVWCGGESCAVVVRRIFRRWRGERRRTRSGAWTSRVGSGLATGKRCDPFTVSDLASRYVLRLQALDRPDGAHVWPILEATFREVGLAEVIRSDHGPP